METRWNVYHMDWLCLSFVFRRVRVQKFTIALAFRLASRQEFCILYSGELRTVGRGSSVGIATRYGLDGPVIQSGGGGGVFFFTPT
jgi:hypothetical protein